MTNVPQPQGGELIKPGATAPGGPGSSNEPAPEGRPNGNDDQHATRSMRDDAGNSDRSPLRGCTRRDRIHHQGLPPLALLGRRSAAELCDPRRTASETAVGRDSRGRGRTAGGGRRMTKLPQPQRGELIKPGATAPGKPGSSNEPAPEGRPNWIDHQHATRSMRDDADNLDRSPLRGCARCDDRRLGLPPQALFGRRSAAELRGD